MTNQEKMILNERMHFTPMQIDAAYINSLVELVNRCHTYNVELDKVCAFQGGWVVTFKGYKGDAICHDHSYGSPCYGAFFNESARTNDWSASGMWETTGFPWDHEDVTVHSASELAFYIAELNRGRTHWENEDC